MRNLIKVKRFSNAINVLNGKSTLEKGIEYTSGTGLISVIPTNDSNKNTVALKAIFTRHDFAGYETFDLKDILTTKVKKTGDYIFAVDCKSSVSLKIKINAYVNGNLIKDNELVNENITNDYSTYSQSLYLEEDDILDFTFSILGEVGTEPIVDLYLDCFSLNFNLGYPAIYSYPYSVEIGGVYDYNNNGVSQNYTSTPIHILNTGLGAYTNKNFILRDIDDIYNTTTNEFNFSKLNLGDVIEIRLNCDITTTTNNQISEFYATFGIGSTLEYSLSFGKMYHKTIGKHENEVIYLRFYIGNLETKNYPAKIFFKSDDNCSVNLIGFCNFVTKKIL